MKNYIYKITNKETGKYYIGSQCSKKMICVNYWTSSTDKEFVKDFKENYMTKYEVKFIKFFDGAKECIKVENYIIRNALNKKDGLCLNRHYNCGKSVFSTFGRELSEETKMKISASRKNQKLPAETREKISASLSGKNHPLFGKKHSIESIIKMSEAHKGNTAMLGKHHSEEAKLKISASKIGKETWMKGKKHTLESRKKMSEAHKGQICSKETRLKMSAIHKGNKNMLGKHHSESTKKHLSEAILGKIFWNNGIINIRAEECPGEGFVRGRLKRKK